MNMSEDVTAVSMQVSEKAAEAALSAFKSVLDSVGRLFRELTDRDELAIDSMIVCSAAEPQKHIVVEGGHNGTRVVHDYTVCDGGKQLAKLTDAETTDAEGKAVRTESGKTAWTELKAEMLEASGMDKDAVLTFSSQEEYEQYLADTETLTSADEMPDANGLAEDARGNGHELHPEGDVLDALHEDSPLPDTPDIPDVPTPPRGARR